jgi:flagellar basal body rod protein FlgG
MRGVISLKDKKEIITGSTNKNCQIYEPCGLESKGKNFYAPTDAQAKQLIRSSSRRSSDAKVYYDKDFWNFMTKLFDEMVKLIVAQRAYELTQICSIR